MSRFSGKCDFYDSVMMIHCDNDPKKLEELLANATIRITGKDGRYYQLHITNEKEAAKYYPYLEAVAAFCDGKANILLSSTSFIDEEEKERLQWHIDEAFKYYRKCKRKKMEFNVDEYLNEISYFKNDYIDRSIAEQIAKHGKNATFDDIHFEFHEYYRKQWFEEMVRLGWSESEAFCWCFNEFYPKDEIVQKRLGRIIKEN